MSDFKGMLKTGWHPKGKEGGRESWRGDFKGIGQVAGWVGKGKQSEAEAAQEHVSRPLTTLKDPSSFGPPPKNVNYHGGAALPNTITPHRSGLGAPLTPAQTTGGRGVAADVHVQEEEQPVKPPLPSLPYRTDRTGLRTDHLPPPPTHRDVHHGAMSPSLSQTPVQSPQLRLPPRLPARQNTASPPASEPHPPSYNTAVSQPKPTAYINGVAVRNLTNAGVSVPSLGIGSQNDSNPWTTEHSQSQGIGTNQPLQSRSRLDPMNTSQQETGTTSSFPSTQIPSSPQTSMPSLQQSQSAFTTAQNFRNNPQSVSLADAHSAAQTAGQAQRSASAFREKHADKISTAQTKAKAWDQKYKVTSKLNKFLDEHSSSDPQQQQQHQQQQQQQQQYGSQQSVPQYPNEPSFAQPAQPTSAYNQVSPAAQYPVSTYSPVQSPPPAIQSPPPAELSASIARKPPPPPAPRKPAKLQAPPPVPTGTKPSFS